MPHQDLITIITPAYNVGHYLESTVISVVTQSYRNFEYLIVDDGSDDNTAAIAASWAKKDGRVKLMQTDHGGSAAARNTALREATGELIAFIDGDDLWDPTFLSTTSDRLDQCPSSTVGVFCRSRRFSTEVDDLGTHDFEAGSYDYLRMLNLWNPPGNGSSLLLRRRPMLASGGFDENLRSSVDLDMWLQLLRHAGADATMIGISDVLVSYRQRNNSVSSDVAARFDSLNLIIDRYGSGLKRRDRGFYVHPIVLGFRNDRRWKSTRLFLRAFPLGKQTFRPTAEWRQATLLLFGGIVPSPLRGVARKLLLQMRRVRQLSLSHR